MKKRGSPADKKTGGGMIEKEIGIFYLDRPAVANAFDSATALLLEKEVNLAVSKHELGFIISSRHPRVFCAGGDLQAYRKMTTKSQGVASNRKIRKTLRNLSTLPLFVVAAVEGETIGGGCELALACDWIIASRSAAFSFKQISQQLVTGWGGGQRLLARVRPSVALDWLTSGRQVGALEAFRQGLVDQLCPEGATLDEARQFILNRAPMTGGLLKEYKELVARGGLGEEKSFEKLWFNDAHRKVLRDQ